MTIVSSLVAKDIVRRDGRRDTVERHTDHLGIAHPISYMAEPRQDTAPLLAQHAVEKANSLRNNELEQARDSLEGGADPSTVTVKHSTRNQMRRFLLRHFLRSEARAAIRVIRLIDSLTDRELRNLLNIGQARIDAIRSRVTDLKALKPSLDADDLRVER